jgi:predicted permease
VSVSVWRRLTHGLRALINPRAADRDVADEVQHYLEQATSENLARGMSAEASLRAARLEIGNATTMRETVRGSGWENSVETLIADVRHAVRGLRGAPGFTTVILGTLALGIGATTAIFSAVKPILIDPLPYPDAGRIVVISEMRADGGRNEGTFGMYRELARRSTSLETIAVLRSWQPTMTSADEPERFDGQRVTASYFQVLGVQPRFGRDFEPSDDRPGGPRVVILGDAVWRRRFGADPGIIGRSVTLDGTSYAVIGVMPADFENVLAPSAGVWTALQYDMSQGRAWGHHLRTVARLKPSVTVADAARELRRLGQEIIDELRPETYAPRLDLAATSLQDDITRGVRPALLAIVAAVALVLAIACVNVTNLLLARGETRRGEFALRLALGAARGRLIRQLLTESLLLAVIGGAIGMLVANAGVRALVALAPPGLPRLDAVRIDGGQLIFGIVVTALVGLVFGVAPAIQAARGDPHGALQQGSRRVAGALRRTRAALLIAQVSVALVLLVSAGLLLRSMERLFSVPVGFDVSNLLTMQVQASGPRFTDKLATDRFFEEALEAVQRVPGVAGAAFTSQLPLSGDLDAFGVRPELTTESSNTLRYSVSAGYLQTMGIPLVRGRLLDIRDVAGAPPVAVVNASLARRLFNGADALGRRVEIGPPGGPPYTIVGIVGDVAQMSLAVGAADAIYTTAPQWLFSDNVMSLVVRTRGDAAALAPAVRDAIWSVDKDQAVVRVATMENLLDATAAERRFALILFEAFALAALALAAAGIYGVVSGSVVERTREIGVRSALGASRGRIVALVLRQGLTFAGIGLIVGLPASVLATQGIAAMLFDVSHLDPTTYVGVTALIVAVAVLASGVPAWRAARVDPASTLRAE